MPLDVARPYVLFLADIKASSKLSSSTRERVFGRIRREIKKLNSMLAPPPALKLSISYGDEIAGLFEDARNTYHVADCLREAAFPDALLRFVVIRDTIGVSSSDIRQLGGTVFKRAGQEMEFLKRKNRFCRWGLDRVSLDGPLEVLVELSNDLIRRMTAYQREIWRLLRSGHSRSEIADLLGKHRQSVSRAAREGGAELVIMAEDQISRLLSPK